MSDREMKRLFLQSLQEQLRMLKEQVGTLYALHAEFLWIFRDTGYADRLRKVDELWGKYKDVLPPSEEFNRMKHEGEDSGWELVQPSKVYPEVENLVEMSSEVDSTYPGRTVMVNIRMHEDLARYVGLSAGDRCEVAKKVEDGRLYLRLRKTESVEGWEVTGLVPFPSLRRLWVRLPGGVFGVEKAHDLTGVEFSVQPDKSIVITAPDWVPVEGEDA